MDSTRDMNRTFTTLVDSQKKQIFKRTRYQAAVLLTKQPETMAVTY